MKYALMFSVTSSYVMHRVTPFISSIRMVSSCFFYLHHNRGCGIPAVCVWMIRTIFWWDNDLPTQWECTSIYMDNNISNLYTRGTCEYSWTIEQTQNGTYIPIVTNNPYTSNIYKSVCLREIISRTEQNIAPKVIPRLLQNILHVIWIRACKIINVV